MNLTTAQKSKIVAAIVENQQFFTGSATKYATSLGINPSVFSRLMKGETEKIMKEADWVRIGRHLNVSLTNRPAWVVAHTPTYVQITEDLAHCKANSVARVFCDKADIGKTFAAKDFARKNQNTVYLDCSQHKTKRAFIRALAQCFGLDSEGKLLDVQNDLTYYVQSLEEPLIILDEAGDLSYEAWLELKALWNALEYTCGWYMIGADGLKAKIQRNVRGKKVGYAEIFRRFGSDYRNVTPDDDAQYKMFFRAQAEAIIRANMRGASLKELLPSGTSLTRLQENIIKLKRKAA